MRCAGGLAALLALAAPAVAAAQDVSARAVATIGEVTTYRGSVTVPEGVGVRWLAPDTTGMVTWGTRRAGRVSLGGGRGTENQTAHPQGIKAIEKALSDLAPGGADWFIKADAGDDLYVVAK